jgi:hypothetical protein
MSEAIKRASFAVEDMKEGGGNLWGSAGPVRATIVGGVFTKQAPDGYNAEGNPIFGKVDFLLAGEGPEEERRVDSSFSLGAQAGDNFTISPDGQYLIPVTDDAQIVKDCKFGTFTGSLQREGVPTNILREFEFSKITGLDGDWKRVTDKARDFGDRPTAPGQKKKFAPSTLQLVKLHTAVKDGALVIGAKPAAATSAPAASAAPAASNAPQATGDVDADTWTLLERVLRANGNTIQRGRITLAVSKEAGAGNPGRGTYSKRAAEESFLNEMAAAGVLTYDQAGKGQPVTLAA